MIVLDTHVWLWWVSEPARLSSRVRGAIEDEDRIGVCTVSCWEVAMLVARSRISLDRDVRVWVAQALAQDRVETIPLTADIALEAGLVDHHRFSGDPVDRILYATAQGRDALLATKDRNLRSFDRRRVVW